MVLPEAVGPVSGEWAIFTSRPVVGRLIVFVKRILRKLLRGYIPQIVEEGNARARMQNQVLLNLISAAEEMQNDLSAVAEERKQYAARIRKLEEQVEKLENERKSSGVGPLSDSEQEGCSSPGVL